MWSHILACVRAAATKGRFFCLLAALLVVRAAGAEEIDFDTLTVDYRDGSYAAHLAFAVAARPEIVREVLTDFDHMAAFVPNLDSSRLLEHEGNVYRIAQRGKARLGPFSIGFESERRVEWFPDGRLVADALSGKLRRLHSEMRIEALGAGSHLDYRIEMVPESWFPSSLGTSFMRHELAEQFSAMAREMLRREARGKR